MRAMILAAGRGKRMRHLTHDLPKPLVNVGGRYLIEYAIESLKKAGIHEILINVSYQKDLIQQALGDGRQNGVKLVYSIEPEPLETGGGIVQALSFFQDQPFVVVSCDVISDFPIHTLMAKPVSKVHLVLVDNPVFHIRGDFGLLDGVISYAQTPYLTFANIGLYHPSLFDQCQPGYFSLAQVLKPAILAGQVSGEYFAGSWHNIGSPEDINHYLETLA
jgi:MurNAc alpha-1-phosphate uridylyltransferase